MQTDGPSDIGICSNPSDPADVATCAKQATAAQQRLLMCKESGDEGWWGTWAEVAFSISRTSPYLTTPRQIARIEALDLCGRTIPVNNQFYEYLQFGNGRMPRVRPNCQWPLRAVYTRNAVPLFVDPPTTPFYLAVYPTNTADIAASKKVLIQGVDLNGVTLYDTDATTGLQVTGNYLILQSPFAILPVQLSSITGIQKDITQGPVQFFSIDPTTGTQTLLLTMEPSEQTASYRRYFFNALPNDCCGQSNSATTLTVTALCKLEPVPLIAPTDYFVLQGDTALEAITNEAQAIRYSKIDEAESKQMSGTHHKTAVELLNGILAHYLGTVQNAVNFKPFGSARLARRRVGMI